MNTYNKKDKSLAIKGKETVDKIKFDNYYAKEGTT